MAQSPRIPVKDGRVRVVIEGVTPQVDSGRYPVKRVVGEPLVVGADVFTDGHDSVSCALLFRAAGETRWHAARMVAVGNDRWEGTFTAHTVGRYAYSVLGWVDHLLTWQRDLVKRRAAGQELHVDLLRGSQLVGELAKRLQGDLRRTAEQWAERLADADADEDARYALAQDPAITEMAWRHPDPSRVMQFEPILEVEVGPLRARYSAWYELFPRSLPGDPGRHGTLADVKARLPDIAAMGFDVLYLPPIHPIGRAHRKGPNNSATAGPDDIGSPWAIGGPEGGHKSVHPDLGTVEDLRDLATAARAQGIELALDIAFQCSPDHPYVTEHPEWFLKRPDGSIQYAENPPKKYQDIYPFDFECADWRALWEELASVVEYWIAQGVQVFRVDNPHTKPFAFWEWLIARITAAHPEVVFLSEAFTRPRVMQRLAKLGFTQSYTYFTWRNTRQEIEQYFTELSRPPLSDFFRPNLWPNTPDILPEYLQFGGRPAFMTRLVLAATLGASYGIYGPAFELLERAPRVPGAEEYLDSEKYQLRQWDLAQPGNLREFITRVNRIRRENPALHTDRGLVFHRCDNDTIVVYSKGLAADATSGDAAQDAGTIIVVASVDPHHVQSGWLDLDLAALGLSADRPYQVHDLLADARFLWNGSRNFVRLDPSVSPAHVLRIRRRVHTERDFDYFL